LLGVTPSTVIDRVQEPNGLHICYSRRLANPRILRPCSEKCIVAVCHVVSNVLLVGYCITENRTHFVVFSPYSRDFCVVRLSMCDVLRNCHI
jgi:hypothetical protein